jgi:maltooligosyltrehalose trehalohydrolase
MFTLYRSLIALRRSEPDLADPQLDLVEVTFDEDARWLLIRRGGLHVAINLASTAQTVQLSSTELVLSTGDATVVADGVDLGPQTAAILRTV